MFDSVQEGLSEIFEKVSDEAASQGEMLACIDRNIKELSEVVIGIVVALSDIRRQICGTAPAPEDKKHVNNPCG